MSNFFEPSLSHRFMVTFFFEVVRGLSKVPSPVDLRFKQVRGLSRQLNTGVDRQGGENTIEYRFPLNVSHTPITLERGVIVMTPLTYYLDDVFTNFKTRNVDATIILLNERWLPIGSWLLTRVMPLEWTWGELNADSSAVLIDQIKLAYEEMLWTGSAA